MMARGCRTRSMRPTRPARSGRTRPTARRPTRPTWRATASPPRSISGAPAGQSDPAASQGQRRALQGALSGRNRFRRSEASLRALHPNHRCRPRQNEDGPRQHRLQRDANALAQRTNHARMTAMGAKKRPVQTKGAAQINRSLPIGSRTRFTRLPDRPKSDSSRCPIGARSL
jgi:hypothetical protein